MKQYMRRYLSLSSVHGLQHVGDARQPLLVRAAWSTAVAASMTISAVMVSSSLRETGLNPIVTTTDYVPVQVQYSS